MHCTNCGLECSSTYCQNCGEKQFPLPSAPSPVQTVYVTAQATPKGGNTMGIVAFVISLFEFFYCVAEARLTLASGSFVGIGFCLTALAFYAANKRNLRLGLTVTALVLSCLSLMVLV